MTRPMTEKLLTLSLVAQGLSDEAVCAASGTPKGTVRRWRTDPRNAHILSTYARNLIDIHEENARMALAVLRGILLDGDGDPAQRLQAATQTLYAHSRAVAAGGMKKIGDAAERAVTASELEERRARLAERLLAHTTVIDADGDDDDAPRH